MKAIVIIGLVTCFSVKVTAQKIEVLVSGNSGLFSFTGNSSARVTQLSYNPKSIDVFGNYVTNVDPGNYYGSKGGLSRGLSASIQRISKTNSILGIQAGYEAVQSRVEINSVRIYNTGQTDETHDATGKTNHGYKMINLNPYIGYRIETKSITYDLHGVVELARIVGSYQRIKAVDASGNVYSFSSSSTAALAGFKSPNPIFHDVRLGIQFTAYYKRLGAYIGYSQGLVNYSYSQGYGLNVATSRISRFGITYKLLTHRKV